MENDEELYESICRVCLSMGDTKNMVSLTDITSSDGLSVYGKAVITFANISIKNDKLPSKMCQNCLLLLKHAIVFKKQCELSHQKLEKLAQKCHSSTSEMKQNLGEIIMFTQCFAEELKTETYEKSRLLRKPDNLHKNEPLVELNSESKDDSFVTDCHENDFDNNSNENLDRHDLLLDQIEQSLKMDPKTLYSNQKRYNSNKNTQKLNKKKSRIKRKTPRKALRDIQCKICNKVLANALTYNNHMRRHSTYRYICEHCAKNFATLSELQYHLASTHGIGWRHSCKVCGFKAVRQHQLTEHERLHTGERPYACDKCGLTFRTQFIWKKHAIYHMEKTVQCQQCPRKFYLNSHLLAHMNNVHERVYVFGCNECEVTYAKPATVRRHLIEKHGIPKEEQGKIKRINLGRQYSTK